MILLTANRSMKGKDSLEQVIREECLPNSLPVVTLANVDRIIEPYIQQVIWAKKYLSRKNEGFRNSILNSKNFIENHYQLINLTMSLKKQENPNMLYISRFLQ